MSSDRDGMWVGWMSFDLLLGDVHSLKQKRSIVRPLIADLRRLFAVSAGFVGPTFIYSIRDTGTNLADREQNFGAIYSGAEVAHRENNFAVVVNHGSFPVGWAPPTMLLRVEILGFEFAILDWGLLSLTEDL